MLNVNAPLFKPSAPSASPNIVTAAGNNNKTKPSTLDIRDEDGNVLDLSQFKVIESTTTTTTASSNPSDSGDSLADQGSGGDNNNNMAGNEVMYLPSSWAILSSYSSSEEQHEAVSGHSSDDSAFSGNSNSCGPPDSTKVYEKTELLHLRPQASDAAVKRSNQANLVEIIKQYSSNSKTHSTSNNNTSLTLGANTSAKKTSSTPLPSAPSKDVASSNSANLSQDLLALLETGLLSDMTVVVGGEELPVHRAILCARAKYFLQVHNNESLEGCKDGPIKIEDVKLEVFQALLRFLYTGTVPVPQMEAYAEELLVAASKVGVTDFFFT